MYMGNPLKFHNIWGHGNKMVNIMLFLLRALDKVEEVWYV